MEAAVLQKKITNVIVNTSPHKFSFFFADPARYPDRQLHKRILKAGAIAEFVRKKFTNLKLISIFPRSSIFINEESAAVKTRWTLHFFLKIRN